MKVLELVSIIGLMGCSELEQSIVPKSPNKIGCICKDGTYILWDETLLKQTSHLTGNPCWDRGGIVVYTYK